MCKEEKIWAKNVGRHLTRIRAIRDGSTQRPMGIELRMKNKSTGRIARSRRREAGRGKICSLENEKKIRPLDGKMGKYCAGSRMR